MEKNQRRTFLKYSLAASMATLTCGACGSGDQSEEETVKVLTTDGQLVEVPKSNVKSAPCHGVSPSESRKGIPGKKFVMVVDLSRCRNARKCIESCEKYHEIPPDRPFIKVLKMQDNNESSPYWMPKKCFQCDNPPCVKVCPVGATYKRSDGIVLIDNIRCIGCRFCMSACPYSARVFNWGQPPEKDPECAYSPETSIPTKVGTVEKCDFCPDMLRQDKLPHCITACPNGAIYFGDKVADVISNGSEVLRFRETLKVKAGYRYLEELGTEPNVYYLPPVNRLFPFDETPQEGGI